MNSPVCRQCDCVKGCQSNPVPCPILLAECIASGQISAAQIEAHRVLDAAIAQPTIKESLTVQAIAQPEQTATLLMEAEDWAELYRLREAVKAPASTGFATWQDLAVSLKRQLKVAQPEQPAPVRQPLTHTEIVEAWDASKTSWVSVRENPYVKFARAIEAAHGITTPKETP